MIINVFCVLFIIQFPQCSGYHVCFTRTRSPVRTRQETSIFCNICHNFVSYRWRTHVKEVGSYGVMVSTLDFESSDPSSNLGRTSHNLTPWRNGSASDSRSEGCVFESRRGQKYFVLWRDAKQKRILSGLIQTEIKGFLSLLKYKNMLTEYGVYWYYNISYLKKGEKSRIIIISTHPSYNKHDMNQILQLY